MLSKIEHFKLLSHCESQTVNLPAFAKIIGYHKGGYDFQLHYMYQDTEDLVGGRTLRKFKVVPLYFPFNAEKHHLQFQMLNNVGDSYYLFEILY